MKHGYVNLACIWKTNFPKFFVFCKRVSLCTDKCKAGTEVHSLACVVVSLQWGPSETFCRRMDDPAKMINGLQVKTEYMSMVTNRETCCTSFHNPLCLL